MADGYWIIDDKKWKSITSVNIPWKEGIVVKGYTYTGKSQRAEPVEYEYRYDNVTGTLEAVIQDEKPSVLEDEEYKEAFI